MSDQKLQEPKVENVTKVSKEQYIYLLHHWK